MVKKFDRSLIPPSPDLSFECDLWDKGLRCLAGIDEAGRGAWAGPVTAAAVIFPPDPGLLARLAGVRDSKQMTPLERSAWVVPIQREALAWGTGFATAAEIDEVGILPATRLAVARALAQAVLKPQHLLVDYLDLPEISLPKTLLVKGDARCLSIAAASVLAKTARDAWMTQADALFPGYGFAAHKGYGTAIHQAALADLGPCAIHRRSFAPLVKLDLLHNCQEIEG
jgi:ribonuclease HII